jgi:membrane protein
MTDYYLILNRFFKEDIWRDPKDAGRIRMLLYRCLRVVLLTINGLKDHFIFLRASALSYSTLLAIVPILAIAFSMMKGLGVQSRLERVMINYLTAEQEELTNRIFDYIAKTDFKVLGALGTVMLIYAVLVMLGNVEKTFNHFWGVTRSRRLVRKISDYVSLLILGPLLMVISTAMLAALPSTLAVQALSRYEFFKLFFMLFNSFIPKVGLWVAFTAMYILVPNTKVKFVPALIAGVICASIWEGAFKVFTSFNVGLANYNKIYGTFAVLPIFIIWLYISWIIVLIGAQLSHVIQNIRSFQQELEAVDFSFSQREKMAVILMLTISELFHKGCPQKTIDDLSQILAVPARLVRELIGILCDQGLLQEIHGEEPVFQPARNPALISVFDVSRAMRHAGMNHWQMPDKPKNSQLARLEAEETAADEKRLGRISLLDLMERNTSIAAG